MYATKTPSLRIHHSDLKCKSGCGFYGNAQWQGYCSKCHREQAHRQRRADKSSTSSESSQREHQVLERQPKPTPMTGFSKFEEKKMRQSDSLKKNKLLKLNVFRKASNAKDVGSGSEKETKDRGVSELTIPASALENQKLDFSRCFPNLDACIERDACKYIQIFFTSILKIYRYKTVDELSDATQNFYQVCAQRMEKYYYPEIDSDTRELLLDFIEKHSMTYLHSVLFSPATCDDEKKDALLQNRIRQLCWVSPKHLDCHIDQGNSIVRDLLYGAISELVAMDSIPSPSGKLSRVVECCQSVVKLIGAASGGPASADELLPALIFTVLKANPPRLLSNINFVTRFCNAARLMTGEGGYYFTNLCCAVSFIENLTPESLNMTKEDFDSYMSLPSMVGGGSWVAALSLCEGLHDVQDQIKQLQDLDRKAVYIENEAKNLEDQVETFKEEILKKISDVLMRTPLDISKKNVAAKLDKTEQVPNEQNNEDFKVIQIPKEEIKSIPLNSAEDFFSSCTDDKTATLLETIPAATFDKPLESSNSHLEVSSKTTDIDKLFLPDSFMNLPTVLSTPPLPTVKTISNRDFLTPSPIFGFGSFDIQSLEDELATPDEYSSEQFLHGLTNVNYDIDLSDLSADNSAAEDNKMDKLNTTFDNELLDKIDGDIFKIMKNPDNLNSGILQNDPWQVRTSSQLPESSIKTKPPLTIQTQDEATSILDSNDSPTAECLLPSPIKPLTSCQTQPNNNN